MSERLSLDLRRRVAAAPVARLATVRPSGDPHLVVITFALDGDTLISAVDHKPKTTTALQRLKNIRANPTVSVLVDHYEDDWSRLWWVRGDGHARVLDDDQARREALAPLVDKYPPYQDNPPQGPVVTIDVQRWVSWSA